MQNLILTPDQQKVDPMHTKFCVQSLGIKSTLLKVGQVLIFYPNRFLGP